MAYEEEEKTRSGLTKQKKAASESENPDTEAAFPAVAIFDPKHQNTLKTLNNSQKSPSKPTLICVIQIKVLPLHLQRLSHQTEALE